jgi:hypothetical protein
MLPLKQKLPIEIGDLNCVEVNYCDVAKAGEHDILEQFAANAASAHDQKTTTRRRLHADVPPL